MADIIVTPIYLDFGAGKCEGCHKAPRENFLGIAFVDCCQDCRSGLLQMAREYPERIAAYDSSKRQWYYTEAVRQGPDSTNPSTPGGDHNVRFAFGVNRAEDYFGVEAYMRLLVLRSDIQNQRIAANLLHQDGF